MWFGKRSTKIGSQVHTKKGWTYYKKQETFNAYFVRPQSWVSFWHANNIFSPWQGTNSKNNNIHKIRKGSRFEFTNSTALTKIIETRILKQFQYVVRGRLEVYSVSWHPFSSPSRKSKLCWIASIQLQFYQYSLLLFAVFYHWYYGSLPKTF